VTGERARVARPRLVLSAGDRLLESIALDRPRLSIGRRADNDIALDHLTVSAEHAVVIAGPGGAFIHDLRSRNGTLVNGLRIDEHRLEHGDLVEVGIFRMRFVDEPADGGSPRSAPHVAAAGIAERAGAEPAGAGASSRQGLVPAALECLDGSMPPRVLPIDQPIVALHAGEVVAVVARRLAGHFITHLEGGAFPRLNGIPIGLQPQVLADGDLIDLAGELYRFREPPPEGGPGAGQS
jgi:predicted component of type VI protein secretion system